MELHSIVSVNLANSDSSNQNDSSAQNSNEGLQTSGLEVCPLCKHSNVQNGLNLRQHMEKEHKIPPDFVEKFLKMAQMDQTSANRHDDASGNAMGHSENDSDKENDFFRVTQEPEDMSANAYLLPESKCKALEEDCLRCQHCVLTFSNIDDFYKHQSESGHGETPSSSGFLCFKKGCNQYFQSIDYLKLHFHEIHSKSNDISSHTNFPYICKLCNLLAFPSEVKLTEHTDLHAKVSSVTHACAHCEWQVPSGVTDAQIARSMLRQHLSDDHQALRQKKTGELEREQATPETTQRAPSLSALSPSGFSCPLQPDEAMSSSTHDSFFDPNRKFKCFACRIGFEKQIQLAAHTRSHSHKRLSMDSAGIDAQSVSNTTRYYDSSRKFKCDICVDAFSTRQQLYAHNNSVQHVKRLKEVQEEATTADDKKSYKCYVCDISFKEKTEFESHSMSVEHLTYMANISRLVQEGRLQQSNADSVSSNSQTPLNNVPGESQGSSSSGLQSSLSGSYPLNLLAMQYAAANSSKPLSLNHGFSPLLPVGVNPSLLPQFLHNMFYRFPFQNSNLPYFSNPLQLPPPPPPPQPTAAIYPPGVVCPVCGSYVSGLEAMSQHACFRSSASKTAPDNNHDNVVFRSEESQHPTRNAHEEEEGEDDNDDANSNDSVDREIHRPLQICTESGSDSSRPLSTDSVNMNSLKSSLNESHTLNPTSTSHSKHTTMSSSTAAVPVMPSPGLSIPFFTAPASTNAAPSSLATINYAAATSMSIPSQVTPIYSNVTPTTSSTDNTKRGRTRINEDQLKVLRSFFDISNSPSDAKIQEMSQLTGLQCRVIKHWFRNTLFKERQRNKNSPYNFSVPPSTSLNLEEYEKTGRVEIKNEQDEDANDSKDMNDRSMDLDQNKNLKENPVAAANHCKEELVPVKNVKQERTSSPGSSASSISFSDTATSEGEPCSDHRNSADTLLIANTSNSTISNDGSLVPTNCTAISSNNLPAAVIPNLFNNPTLTHNPCSSDFASTLAASTWANYMQACKTNDPTLSSNALTANNLISLVANVANPTSACDIAHPVKSMSSNNDVSSVSVVKSNVFKRKQRDEDYDEIPSGKRIRTTITPEQQDILLTYYQKDPNPSRKQMDVIAQQVDLSKRVVQVWFQNTRSRDRKGLLRNSGSQVLPISKRCPFCHVLFKVRNALEVHLLQCHGNKWSPAGTTYPPDSTTISSEVDVLTDQIKCQDMSQTESKVLDDSVVNDFPLDLSNRTSGPVITKSDDLDDSHTVYWDEDSQECNVSGSDAGTKRNRTSISSSQLKAMKAILVHYKTPTNQECDLLGSFIGLSRRVVQVWFQNQRAKEKKHMREINHIESLGSLSSAQVKKRPASKSYLVGDADHPTGCELCEVFFDGTDTASVQEHVLSSEHLQRLVQTIQNDEKSDNLNGQKTFNETGSFHSNQMTSAVPQFTSPVPASAWIIPSQFAINASSK